MLIRKFGWRIWNLIAARLTNQLRLDCNKQINETKNNPFFWIFKQARSHNVKYLLKLTSFLFFMSTLLRSISFCKNNYMFYHGIGKTTDFSIFVTICFQWFLYELNSIIFLTCEWYSNYPPAGNSSLLNVSPLVVWFHFCISLFERFTYFHKNLKKEMCLLSRPE